MQSTQMEAVEQNYLAYLREIIIKHFDEEELRTLSFDLEVDYEDLGSTGKAGKARDLVSCLQRHGRLDELIATGKKHRPNASWDSVSTKIIKSVASPIIPHNLPRRQNFIGRELEKDAVLKALKSKVALISIEGIGGIGKSSLALEVANICLESSKMPNGSENATTFSGFIWSSDKDKELTLNSLLDTICRTLDYPGIAQIPLIDDKRHEVNKLLKTKPYLLIIDNFETIEDGSVNQFLSELPEPSKSLITTREQKITTTKVIPLKKLTEKDALELMHQEGKRLGSQALEKATKDSFLPLYNATDGVPLAFKWATGQIKRQGQSLKDVIASLQGGKGDIFEDIFLRSWSLLSDNARQILLIMPIFSAPAANSAIKAASGLDNDFGNALGQIVEMCLVEAFDEIDLDRDRYYSIHPLTRVYIESKHNDNTDPEMRNEAKKGLSKYYLEECNKRLNKENYIKNLDWFKEEMDNIFIALDWAVVKDKNIFIDIYNSIFDALRMLGYWGIAIQYGEKAIDAARSNKDDISQAEILANIGRIYRLQGFYEKARENYLSAREIAEKISGDYPDLLRTIIYGLAFVVVDDGEDRKKKQENIDDVLTEARTLLSVWKQAPQSNSADEKDRVPGNAREKHLEARILMLEGNSWDKAKDALEESIKISQKNNRAVTGNRLIDMGKIAMRLSELDEAKQFFEQALEESKDKQRKDNQGRAKLELAAVYFQLGDVSEASKSAQQAEEIFSSLNMKTDLKEARTWVTKLGE